MWKVGSCLASLNFSDKFLPQELTHAIVAALVHREGTVDQAGAAALPHEVLMDPGSILGISSCLPEHLLKFTLLAFPFYVIHTSAEQTFIGHFS